MALNSDFADEVVERLGRVVPRLRTRRMLGGVGLYSGSQFFGIVAFDRLWFKVDDSNRSAYEARGMQPFRPFPDRSTTMLYFEVPTDLMHDHDELRIWAMRSVSAARQKKTLLAKMPRKHRASTRTADELDLNSVSLWPTALPTRAAGRR